MKVAVIGTGYVGLVTGVCLAETGNKVYCIDVDEQKVQTLRDGKTPIYEPGLEILLQRNIKEGRILFSTVLKEAVDHADIIFLALPTPPGADGSADLQFVLKVAADIGRLIQPGTYKVIVNKSTVPVGTAEKVKDIILATVGLSPLRGELEGGRADVVSNPEFLREGAAVDDFLKPDRVVIGTSSEKAKSMMNELYQPFVRQGNPIYFMDERSAEMTKYAANAYLAMRISYMNEMANLCEKVGANVDWVRMGIGSDNRIGKRFLFPGIGYGGSCFPKDVLALHHTANENDFDFKLLSSVIEVNKRQKSVLAQKLKNYFGNYLSGKTFAIWGLAFKPETDDIRDAPALDIIEDILAAGGTVQAYDPEAMRNVKGVLGDRISFGRSQYDVLNNADALLVVTEWSEFRNPDFDRIAQLLKNKVIFDGRNVYSLDKMKTLGFYYESIGRGAVGAGNIPPVQTA